MNHLDKIQAIPCPNNLEHSHLLDKIRYGSLLGYKKVLRKLRDRKEGDISQDEFMVFTTEGYTEFYRAIDPSQFTNDITPNKEFMVFLTKEVDSLLIRVGCNPQAWFTSYGIKLKIIDVYGECLYVSPIRTTQFFNTKND